jgi:hypothetical protein
MILKRQIYDDKGRITTTWASGITRAERAFDKDWESDVLRVSFGKDSGQQTGVIVLEKGEGVYLCNDEGKTIEVLSRPQPPTR